jgi:hypothetical protein
VSELVDVHTGELLCTRCRVSACSKCDCCDRCDRRDASMSARLILVLAVVSARRDDSFVRALTNVLLVSVTTITCVNNHLMRLHSNKN